MEDHRESSDMKGDPNREISATGDIILVVGASDSDDPQLRLRVQSTILREASTVFRTMLSPPWIESQDISAKNPKEIQLPEDEPKAMEVVCLALHFRSNLINPHWLEEQGGQRMLDVAILIDKYDLKASMRLITDTWFRQSMGCIMEESIYRMAAAWILEEEEFFAQYSWIVMITYTGPYAKLLSQGLLREKLPPQIFRNQKPICSVLSIIDDLMPLAEEQKIFPKSWCTEVKQMHNDKVMDTRLGRYFDWSGSTICSRLPEWMERETSLCLRCLREDESRADYTYCRNNLLCEHSKTRQLGSTGSAMNLLGKRNTQDDDRDGRALA
ncbi:hypothetical protein NEUTE1DRAFT_48831 [Neurospora tetrasperma FGSC 2508]|uniref:BTB domain-containing protein n=1 Tax=Neurospora tetrasperma (strain FGSC 2508 / ATCC MYA-4615 / P0657) TaxID=510951 RepID=F8MVF2_NEUT8|nr:uncharacterized protein NEUTE1DRAFT_48831 [Neurospora tetrasperma FGSC 2508]EGO54755.1 hypothetical protein NEUTE1DRAFT_48831 [Neurospora tetrasperma FGSC 2508]